jgi:hypothetical protein
VVVSGFEWDDDNILHIDRHEFTPDEVEEVFAGDHKVRRTGQKRAITARNMDASERRLFRRK